jgi:hypothetical protein
MAHVGAHELILWIAAFVLVVGGAIFLALAAYLRFGTGRPGGDLLAAEAAVSLPTLPAEAVDRSIIRIVAILSLGAAAIHLAAAPHHYIELGDLGAGFVIAGVFQALWARKVLAATTRRIAWIGIVVNLAIVAAWIVSRSVGLPAGASPWTPEAIGLPDAASTIFELLIVAGLALRLLGIDRAPIARCSPVRSLAAIAVIPTLGLVLLATSLATVAIATGADHGPGQMSPVAGADHAMTGH